jgi:hypothetical protein
MLGRAFYALLCDLGVMIKFPQWGLIHYEQPEPDLRLIGRAQTATN